MERLKTGSFKLHGCSFFPGNGTQQLDWVEIAHVIPDGDGGFNFQYLPGESDATTWPSELESYQ